MTGASGWELADLVAALDPAVVPRLLAGHPAEGWCRPCRITAPCPTRTLATAADRVARPRPAGGDRIR